MTKNRERREGVCNYPKILHIFAAMSATDGNTDFEAGVILPINKPLGWTSSDVVRKVKFALSKAGYRKIKVGHAGTLDPLATGVLILCIGKATKRVGEIQALEKEYTADIVLGATTPSHDLEHPVDRTYPHEHIDREMIEAALARLSGERMQTPPAYSAKMVGGRRAYEYAREGSRVEMRQALINIYAIQMLEYDHPRLKIRVRCSKGTYIRSLAREIGEELQSGAYLGGLCRTKNGGVTLEDCLPLEDAIKNLRSG